MKKKDSKMETKKRWETCNRKIHELRGEGKWGQQITPSKNVQRQMETHSHIPMIECQLKKNKQEELMILNNNNGINAKMKYQFEYQTQTHQSITERHIICQ